MAKKKAANPKKKIGKIAKKSLRIRMVTLSGKPSARKGVSQEANCDCEPVETCSCNYEVSCSGDDPHYPPCSCDNDSPCVCQPVQYPTEKALKRGSQKRRTFFKAAGS